MPSRTLVVGHVTHDRYADRLRAGGCAFYGGLAHRAFGARVELATVIGEDFACADELSRPGLELELPSVRAGKTTVFRNTYPRGGRRVQTVAAVARPVDCGAVSAGSRDVLHLAPVLHEVDLQAWVAQVPARWVGINVQGWTRAIVPQSNGPAHVETRPWRVTQDELRGVDLACLSDEDLDGQGDLLTRLRQGVSIVALTHGERGCELFMGDQVISIGVHPANVVDPTGAGDTFSAALLQALAQGEDLVPAARLAGAAASVIIQAEGASAITRVAAVGWSAFSTAPWWGPRD